MLIAVIPALDEEGSIGAVIQRLLAGGVTQVIVADNGSRDRTAEVARHSLQASSRDIRANSHPVDAPDSCG